MWQLKEPAKVKLIAAILAADERCLEAAIDACVRVFGSIDMYSEVWPFTLSDYYTDEVGSEPFKQLVSFEVLVDPGELSRIKHQSNDIEKKLAGSLDSPHQRPANIDPGIVEPSKLVLASTKNFSHRIYIGDNIYAEVTLIYDKGKWTYLPYTYPDYRQQCYFDFFSKVRRKVVEQLKS